MEINQWRDFVIESFRKVNKTYNGQSYIVHCDAVAKVASKFGHSTFPIQAACLGHDLIEDTKVSRGLIAKIIGFKVAELIWLVTDKGGGNRESRHKATYPLLSKDNDAVIVKLSDRIANVETGGKIDMYRKEYPYFKEILYTQGKNDSMWKHLNNLLK